MKTYQVRKFEQKDIDYRVEWFNSPEIYSKMPIEIPVSHATTMQWFSKILLDDSRADFVLEIVYKKISKEIVAMAGIVDINLKHRRCEIYILVSPNRTGKGIGSIFMRWLCNYSFHHCGMEKLFLYTLESNKGARKFYERLGFVEEGVLRKHQIHNGTRANRYVQGLLRSDWERLSWCSTGPVSFIIYDS